MAAELIAASLNSSIAADLIKIIGGGVAGFFVGWVSHIRLEYSKRRRMQRNLYRELAENYGTLWEAQNLERPMSTYASRGRLPYRLQFEYFNHAQKDLDTFNEVTGFAQITDLYLAMKELDTRVHAGFSLELVEEMNSICHGIEEAAHIGYLDKGHLLKHAPAWVTSLLQQRIQARAEEVSASATEW